MEMLMLLTRRTIFFTVAHFATANTYIIIIVINIITASRGACVQVAVGDGAAP